MMKAYLLFVVAGLAGLYIKRCEAGYCTESYSCPSTCYCTESYSCPSTCYCTESYSCPSTCYCTESYSCPSTCYCTESYSCPSTCYCTESYSCPSTCYCTESYSCPSTCYTPVKYKTSCGSWWRRNNCYKTKSQSYSCTKVCYRRVCCKGYTGTGCRTPICFGSTTCPNGGKCVRPDYCTCLPGYAIPRCSVCSSSRLPTVPNGQYKQYSGLKSVAFLTCSAGYDAEGAGTVLCQSNGYWSRSSASCQPRSCCSLPSVSNGQFKPISNSVSLNAVAQIQCATGYVQFPASTNPYQIKCGTSGLWYPIRSEISCKLTDCGTPTATLNGRNYDIVNGTLFGNQAILTCNETHVLQGEPTFIQCQASGKWSSSSAICTPICPVRWIDHENSCYLFGNIELNYTDARQLCLENDATLVQVESVSENVFLKREMVALAENDKAMEPVNGYWNDLFEDTSNGQEIWRETNTTLDPKVSDWDGNQPNDYGGQQSCTMFWKDFQYRWADIECDAVGKPDKVSKRLGRALCEREKMVQGRRVNPMLKYKQQTFK